MRKGSMSMHVITRHAVIRNILATEGISTVYELAMALEARGIKVSRRTLFQDLKTMDVGLMQMQRYVVREDEEET